MQKSCFNFQSHTEFSVTALPSLKIFDKYYFNFKRKNNTDTKILEKRENIKWQRKDFTEVKYFSLFPFLPFKRNGKKI